MALTVLPDCELLRVGVEVDEQLATRSPSAA